MANTRLGKGEVQGNFLSDVKQVQFCWVLSSDLSTWSWMLLLIWILEQRMLRK
ncbi:predicted protein [Arabidopsis lyrata subsp. lyrata]|uniref:Predicted protein n=1 Tax=Arabidopsis lyrata subsp. lyrata TaxID=81972 RepID=D7KSQ5_ARALL|nr:predicted protein [Arabidopsis lyrata subsp. lyrata]